VCGNLYFLDNGSYYMLCYPLSNIKLLFFSDFVWFFVFLSQQKKQFYIWTLWIGVCLLQCFCWQIKPMCNTFSATTTVLFFVTTEKSSSIFELSELVVCLLQCFCCQIKPMSYTFSSTVYNFCHNRKTILYFSLWIGCLFVKVFFLTNKADV
jgi:hypothetical protein